MNEVPCPHCGRAFAYSGNVVQHAAVCPRNPAVRERLAAAIADPDNPGCAVSSSQYRRVSGALGLPSVEVLWRAFGRWEDVAAEFGLKPQRTISRPYHPPARSEAERMAALDAEVGEMEERAEACRRYWDNRGLPVLSSRTLPDGRVAHMLR